MQLVISHLSLVYAVISREESKYVYRRRRRHIMSWRSSLVKNRECLLKIWSKHFEYDLGQKHKELILHYLYEFGQQDTIPNSQWKHTGIIVKVKITLTTEVRTIISMSWVCVSGGGVREFKRRKRGREWYK